MNLNSAPVHDETYPWEEEADDWDNFFVDTMQPPAPKEQIALPPLDGSLPSATTPDYPDEFLWSAEFDIRETQVPIEKLSKVQKLGRLVTKAQIRLVAALDKTVSYMAGASILAPGTGH